ncbi:MAG: recombinase family protein [Planctomycetaceae bacterium]|jgi:DNA invertase Pin-like site-specific DNA recombinase|nr:recombinase family protein [Planctomycetaceae bacterium]
MSKHIAVYVRVSTTNQDQRSQVADLEKWAASQDSEIVWYKDKFSGKTMDRPAWNRLLKAIEEKKVSQIAVWRLDRLGRTAKGLTALFDELTSKKIGLFSLKDSLDLKTPAGRLMANVLASVAAYETEVRAERVQAGQAIAKANGKTWGGSQPGRLIHVTSEQKAQVIAMEGQKIAVIARTVGLSRPTVYRLLGQQ